MVEKTFLVVMDFFHSRPDLSAILLSAQASNVIVYSSYIIAWVNSLESVYVRMCFEDEKRETKIKN